MDVLKLECQLSEGAPGGFNLVWRRAPGNLRAMFDAELSKGRGALLQQSIASPPHWDDLQERNYEDNSQDLSCRGQDTLSFLSQAGSYTSHSSVQ